MKSAIAALISACVPVNISMPSVPSASLKVSSVVLFSESSPFATSRVTLSGSVPASASVTENPGMASGVSSLVTAPISKTRNSDGDEP